MIGSAYAVENYGVTRIAILDFDLHHGDGSQEIVYRLNESEKDIKYGYFSLHDIESFPCENGDREKIFGASLCLDGHGQYIWNVHLEGYKLQEEFDKLYQDKYSVLFTHAFKFLSQHTKGKTLVVLSAGFDASEHETPAMQRHKVNVPTLFYDRFTRDSVILAEKTNSKILSVMEGGYSDRAIISGVMSHLSGLSQPEKFLPIEQYCTTQRLGILEKILHCKKLLLKERDAYTAAVSSTFDGLWDSTSPSESQLLTPGMQLRDRRKAPAANRPRRTRGSPVPDIPRQIDVIGSPTPKGMDELVSGVENLSTIPPAESSLLDTPEIKTESQV
ncbi:Histone deacetylase HOS3 [Neolecta irregularis DAH-3]|uniref:Histone deacetylase HOS3 n=1 Tax=Neolecta irregularis (strain DAH-3) TaxID=1198029 RepID=A0A1U7LIR8_NEOID|nr:Histone deacetylase HOS3 [Neolecta irregularis DAH-3]|eukprot:OLL22539.1 Histone deacetylase HOS3 [Neolecta irregularis DAH-3]